MQRHCINGNLIGPLVNAAPPSLARLRVRESSHRGAPFRSSEGDPFSTQNSSPLSPTVVTMAVSFTNPTRIIDGVIHSRDQVHLDLTSRSSKHICSNKFKYKLSHLLMSQIQHVRICGSAPHGHSCKAESDAKHIATRVQVRLLSHSSMTRDECSRMHAHELNQVDRNVWAEHARQKANKMHLAAS